MPGMADTLKQGAVYFDSRQTMEEVIKLATVLDNEGISRLVDTKHVSPPLPTDTNIILVAVGKTSDAPAEFKFGDDPTTYWTLTKFVQVVSPQPTVPLATTATPVPSPSPTPSPTSSPTPNEDQTPNPPSLAHRYRHRHNSDEPDFNDKTKIWHKVNGTWKWQPVNNKQGVAVRKAQPVTP
jgi:hypothetical protein